MTLDVALIIVLYFMFMLVGCGCGKVVVPTTCRLRVVELVAVTTSHNDDYVTSTTSTNVPLST